jgi:hypothetical protein
LDVELELRRREVAASDDVLAQRLVRHVLVQEFGAPRRVLHKLLLHALPRRGLESIDELQACLWIPEEEAPVRDVGVGRNDVEVARRERQNIVKHEHVLCLLADRYLRREGDLCYPINECRENVVRVSDFGRQLGAAAIAVDHAVPADLTTLLALLDIVAQLPQPDWIVFVLLCKLVHRPSKLGV